MAAAPPARGWIAANFTSLASTGVVGLVITVLLSVYARRVLGPSAIGQVSWAVAAVAYLTVLVSPGLSVVGQRELARAPAQTQRLLAPVLTLQSVLAAVVYGAVLAIAAFEPRGPVTSVLLAVQGVGLFLAAWNIVWVLQAHEHMVGPSLVALALNALQIPAMVLLVHGPTDLVIYAALALPFAFASAVYKFWYLARVGLVQPLRLRMTLEGIGWMLREAWPLALAQASVVVMANSGTLILGFTYGDDAVGQFASAYRLMLVPTVVTAALWNAYFPAFARSYDRPGEAVALSREYLRLVAWIGFPIAAPGWSHGRHVVELLYGPEFAPCGHYFEWLCLTIGLTFLNYGFVATLVPWGRSGLQLKITMSAALLNLIVNAAAVPAYGAWGAVAATLAAELLVVVLGVAIRRRLGLFWHPIWPVIGPSALCSAVVSVGFAVLPATLDRVWWVQLGIGALVLAACLMVFERRVLGVLWRPRDKQLR